MNVAAISSVTSTFVSHPVARLQNIGAPTATSAASAAATAQKAAAAQTLNFGPAVQVSLSQQAQALLTQNAPATTAQAPSQAALSFTYQNSAEQVWIQVLSSLGLTQQELDALPLSQRSATEAKATELAEVRMSQEIQAPKGVSQTTEASAIDTAVQAIAA